LAVEPASGRRVHAVMEEAGSARRETAMIGRVLRNFRIVSQIGEGGMGVVYLAEHTELPKRFAIKSLSKALSNDRDFRKRFYEEAQKQALLDDPNIVQVTDFFEEQGQFFLVMEYVDGQDLSRLIKEKGKLSDAEAIPILRDILKGLGFAHGKGLVHRDMKPSNVLIDKSGRARIMDFGIAVLAKAGEARLTAVGAVVGTPWYMSPEQIEQPRQVDLRTDIYALGIVLYEMLTGEVPFDGETDFSVQYQQIRTPTPDPREKNPKVSEKMAAIVFKAMAKNRSERFQDCAEFLEPIEAIERSRVGLRSKTAIAALVAAALVSAGTLVYVYTRPPKVVQTPPIVIKESSAEEAQARASNVIQSGSERAWYICTQIRDFRAKELGLQAARLKDKSLEENIKKQIQDRRTSVENALVEYSGLLHQLTKMDAPVVAGEFEKYSKSLEVRKAGQQDQIAAVVKSQYERHREAGLTIDGMGVACERAMGKPTPEVFQDGPTEGQSRIAYNVIQSGSEKALVTCTQFQQLKLRKQGLQLAKPLEDTNLEEQIKKQIRDHAANIDHALTDYSDFLDQLGKIDSGIVVQQFDEYTRDLEKRKAFEKIQIARLMKKQYEQQRGGNKRIDVGRMDAECDAALGKGTS
jgi:serine/threonine protein kinase